MELEKLLEMGEKLGLSGKPLRVWLEETMSKEEEKKIAEEARLEARRRAEEEQKIAEEARLEARRVAEEERKIAEHERKRELLDREAEIARLKVEGATIDDQNESFNAPSRGTIGAKAPRLPSFNEGKDPIDSYLLRFERFATINGWEQSSWAIHLSALLQAKALETYSRLSDEDANDYQKVKEALLERYNLTCEGFREKFRTCRPEPGEQMSQFRTRLNNYRDKWVELAGKDKNKGQEVLDMITSEQLMESCSHQLKTFLRERKPSNSEEIVNLTGIFIEAHGRNAAFQKPKSESKSAVDPRKTIPESRPKPSAVNCHNCGKPGHYARECRFRGQKVAAVKVNKIPVCNFCKKTGHTEENCWTKRMQRVAALTLTNGNKEDKATLSLNCGSAMPLLAAACRNITSGNNMPVVLGKLNGKLVETLRDTGSSCVVVKRDLVGPIDPNGPSTIAHLANGKAEKVATTQVTIDCPFYKGTVRAIVMEAPLYDLIIGNIPGAKCPGVIDKGWCCKNGEQHTLTEANESIQAVETRSTAATRVKKLKTPDMMDVGLTKGDLMKLQNEDSSLDPFRKLAQSGEMRKSGGANECSYGFDKGILMRYFRSPKVEHGDMISQVVVPTELRDKVMGLGHESILAGHLAAKKTSERISMHFYWPNLWNDVGRFCQSCDQCQRSFPKGKVAKVPMETVPLIDEPFSRVAIDLIGPILPASERGHRYVLTAVDYSTRYPEAVPLKGIETERVAEALVEIFSRVGVPKEILTDRGTQFTSDVMKEVCRLLSIKQLITSPYHPQCNGLVERFNGTLKMMLKKMTSERPRDWDRYIPAALFAYREAPQESLGFSPFELMYGRTLRGPMAILKELWTNEEADIEVKTTYQYVVDLKNRLEETMKLAQESLRKATFRYKKNFDRKARDRRFSLGEKVLLLLPTKHNKLELKWQGPFEIVKVLGHNNYRLEIKGQARTYHVNMLKRYFERSDKGNGSGVLCCATAAVIQESENADELGGQQNLNRSPTKIEVPCLTQTETFKDVMICEELTKEQKGQMQALLQEFEDVLTDKPGRTDLISHEIRLTSHDPIRKRPYPVPQAFKETMREEVDKMIDAGIIGPSNSPYSSPSVIVKKKDGSNRYCIDFRALNNISVFDAEPMPRPDDLFQEIGSESRFLTKIDLSKGYWQIPLSEDSKPLTAFATERGLFQFNVMPFGLQGAPATFSRLMRKVVTGLPNVHNYLDDCIIHTSNWEDHLSCLRSLLRKLREAGLTARPTKCQMAYPELEFLGHMVGNGKMFPTTDKVRALKDAVPPKTKKEMRSFLGLASFYRRYVPNFAAIASPLTDMTKKGKPNVIGWEEAQVRAFRSLKNALTAQPVLKLPDFSKTFFLQTDASDKGLGAILLQEHDDQKFPVVFLSRRLSSPEENYSVVEKECLALVYAVKTLDPYLQGREFVVITDHAPLLYLNKAKSENGRLMRWALLLHQYRFRIESVKGKDNHGPDFLSRS